ncbi:hypothetical protein EVA_02441 [gut metagenome]|uniref:Uncharacterized protein n=1 Tax=gut metagenome TaxID=749906 RepID=J9D9C5_9ZZZZ
MLVAFLRRGSTILFLFPSTILPFLMHIPDFLHVFSQHPQVAALAHTLSHDRLPLIHAEGLQGSAAPVVLAALSTGRSIVKRPFLLICRDEEEAGYF